MEVQHGLTVHVHIIGQMMAGIKGTPLGYDCDATSSLRTQHN
jgi:hypothetical protein